MFHSTFLNGRFPVKGELESVTAEEQMRTERPRLERTRRASTPTREGAGPPALGKQSGVFHQTAAVLRVWVTGRPARPSAKLAESAQIERQESCSSESQTQSFAVRGNYSCNMALHGPSGRTACLTCPFAPPRVCCAIPHATGSAPSPSQSWRPRASCQTKWNPMCPSSTTSHNGLHANSFEMPNLPLNTPIMRVSFGKRDGT